MLDFARIDGFDWDEGNSRKSSDKHAVSQLEAEQLFANTPLIIMEDTKHSQMEPRYQALGQSNEGRPLFAAFTTREGGAKIRIISVREMSRKERAIYAQET
jgi:uncharacterized DUF497 family protein